MLKKELTGHFLLTIIWLAAITIFHLGWRLNLVWFWLGGLAGTFLLDIDNLFYLWTYPQEPTNQKAISLLKERHFKEAFWLLFKTHEERYRLVFHNVLFQAGFFVLCFYVLASTASFFGRGLVLAAALHLLKDEVGIILAGQEQMLHKGFFWPLKAGLSFYQQKLIIVGMTLVFFGLSFILL